MKRITMSLMALLMFASMAFAAPKKSHDSSYTGEIMDNQCAMMGSHDTMMKKAGLTNAKDCTLACVKGGGNFVLFNANTKTAYELDDQNKPKAFAGQKVKVTGKLDKAKKTIHVENIVAAS